MPFPQVLGTTWVPIAGEIVLCPPTTKKKKKNVLCTLNMVYMTDVISASCGSGATTTRHELERSFDSCGLLNFTTLYQDDPFCNAIYKKKRSTCQICIEKFLKHSGEALKILVSVGLFLSLTWLPFYDLLSSTFLNITSGVHL
uniref:Uncharacterized protein n=1 Tax=Urocitellus parryii TaxID=9999 RepID=A0A8D2H4V7_UROPR